MTMWEYTLQLRSDQRGYSHPDGPRVVHGAAWALTRTCERENGSRLHQSIVASPGVFDTDEEAKHDALEKLSTLSCPLEQPVAQALRWMHEDL